MASSPPTPFDTTFLFFAAAYLLDGFLTILGLTLGLAREGNPFAASFTANGIASAKALGLASIVGIALLAARTRPFIIPKMKILFRAFLLVFAAVCASNLAVLWGAVS